MARALFILILCNWGPVKRRCGRCNTCAVLVEFTGRKFAQLKKRVKKRDHHNSDDRDLGPVSRWWTDRMKMNPVKAGVKKFANHTKVRFANWMQRHAAVFSFKK